VPAFCARRRREAEGAVARAWGQELVVPWFLRDELAGGLAADQDRSNLPCNSQIRCTYYLANLVFLGLDEED
jgi:hypothetical protein